MNFRQKLGGVQTFEDYAYEDRAELRSRVYFLFFYGLVFLICPQYIREIMGGSTVLDIAIDLCKGFSVFVFSISGLMFGLTYSDIFLRWRYKNYLIDKNSIGL
jgi:hypothetical protein